MQPLAAATYGCYRYSYSRHDYVRRRHYTPPCPPVTNKRLCLSTTHLTYSSKAIHTRGCHSNETSKHTCLPTKYLACDRRKTKAIPVTNRRNNPETQKHPPPERSMHHTHARHGQPPHQTVALNTRSIPFTTARDSLAKNNTLCTQIGILMNTGISLTHTHHL